MTSPPPRADLYIARLIANELRWNNDDISEAHELFPVLVAEIEHLRAENDRIAQPSFQIPLVHVLMNGQEFKCQRCGARHVREPSAVLASVISTFLALHRGCEVQGCATLTIESNEL